MVHDQLYNGEHCSVDGLLSGYTTRANAVMCEMFTIQISIEHAKEGIHRVSKFAMIVGPVIFTVGRTHPGHLV